MKKTFQTVYIVLFFLLLCLPMALMPFFHNDASLEKRALAKFPAYLADGRLNLQFSDQFESWVNDHLPLRPQLLTASNTLRGELLHGQTSNVIVGKEGWLFFQSEGADYIGASAMTDDQINALAVTLSLLQERVEENGGRFTFVPMPNKSSVYGEKMPDWYPRAAETNLTRLQAALPGYGVNYTDMLSLLTAHKGEGVYHRRDSHWNYRGALLGYDAILTSLDRDHPDYSDASYTVERTWRGDLDKLLLPAGGVLDDQVIYDIDHAKFRFNLPQGVKDPQAQLATFMSDKEERDDFFSTKNTELSDGSSLLMARDSFGRALLPYMIDSYETATFRRTDSPDVTSLPQGTDVVFEIAERNLPRVIATAPFAYAPVREGGSAHGQTAGEPLTAKCESAGYGSHLYGALPEDADLGEGGIPHPPDQAQVPPPGRRLGQVVPARQVGEGVGGDVIGDGTPRLPEAEKGLPPGDRFGGLGGEGSRSRQRNRQPRRRIEIPSRYKLPGGYHFLDKNGRETGQFIRFRRGSPARYRFRLSRAMAQTRRTVRSRRKPPAVWGVRSRFSQSHRGWSAGRGSGSVTSRAAPQRRPDLRHSARARLSTAGPRPPFRRMASAFIRAIRPLSRM